MGFAGSTGNSLTETSTAGIQQYLLLSFWLTLNTIQNKRDKFRKQSQNKTGKIPPKKTGPSKKGTLQKLTTHQTKPTIRLRRRPRPAPCARRRRKRDLGAGPERADCFPRSSSPCLFFFFFLLFLLFWGSLCFPLTRQKGVCVYIYIYILLLGS